MALPRINKINLPVVLSCCAIALWVATHFSLWPDTAFAKKEASLNPGMVNPGFHTKPIWFKNSFLDIREDVSEATKAGKRIMLYFYQDGCPYCKKLLNDNFGQHQIAVKTQQYFDVIAINMWGDRDVIDLEGQEITEKAFAVQQKVMFTPTLLFLDEQQKVVLRINGYFAPHKFIAALDYAGKGLESKYEFRDYLQAVSPLPSTGQLHQGPNFLAPPYRFDRTLQASDKPLLVLFEQRHCLACDELHLDILSRKESEQLIKKFNVAVLDMWSDTPITTPKGMQLSTQAWATQLQINYAPSMVFFDAHGQEVFRADAYLKAFHVQSAMDYVLSGAYRKRPEFQRFIEDRAERLRQTGVEIEIMR